MDNENTVSITVKRFNPEVDREFYYQTYIVTLTEKQTNLLQALEMIYQEQDETLAFRRYCCGIQFCNSCLMQVDGKPAHACLTILSPGQKLTVEPLAGKEVQRDLIVKN